MHAAICDKIISFEGLNDMIKPQMIYKNDVWLAVLVYVLL